MSRTVSMEILVLISLLAGAFLCYAEAATKCASDEFKCSNGRCTLINNLCDRRNDCGDNSDEQFCDLYHCHPLAFQCLNGKCISRRTYCSGSTDHCGDNSDELYCKIDSSVQCPPGWVRCPSGSKCIPSNWVCDGTNDCIMESEERNCGNNTAETPNYTAKSELKSLFLRKRKQGPNTNRWVSGPPDRRRFVWRTTPPDGGNRTGRKLLS
ncbi:Low-density lipoprotein receptor-related protein 2 [Araneus ventricosus]|uniref:Low-density lipoprotein receptor-related protein 2 n=1 Tax=Araneus ventricosus TaxID=182803 RepID=A0A4Y2IQQ6_ARAVE|nr:Low-density lipoprotein receptor-related protein 2 [Araneus ventricosus]